MGRTSNAAKAVTKIINIHKRPGFFIVTIKNSDGKVIFHKCKVSNEEYLDLYLKNLENNITNHPEFTIEDIINGYIKLWSKFIIISNYIDSYGHRWNNTPLPSKWIKNKVNMVYNTIKNNT